MEQARRYIELRKQKDEIEEQLDLVKKELDTSEKELVMFMENEGLSNIKTENGELIYTREQLYVRVEENKEQELFAWFEEQGMGELIKQSIPNATLRSMAKEQEIPYLIVSRETKIGLRKG